MLFGQAGFLGKDFTDEYPMLLKQEYLFLSKKYGMIPMDAHIWKLLRMRPANFPTIRISQFAALQAEDKVTFRQLKGLFKIEDVMSHFDVAASPYWNNHFYI